jgi:hypothetical protein
MASLASASTAPTECDRALKVRGRLSRVCATTGLQGLSKTRWRFCGKPSHNRGQTTPGCRPKVLHCFGCRQLIVRCSLLLYDPAPAAWRGPAETPRLTVPRSNSGAGPSVVGHRGDGLMRRIGIPALG